MSTDLAPPSPDLTVPPGGLVPAPDSSFSWVVPAEPDPELTVVGINADGELYIYGDTAASPGPVVPAVLGCVVDVTISQHGGSSRYGLRDYLDLRMLAPIPGTGFILRLPCRAASHPLTGALRTPWSVRSLLGALKGLDLTATAVKLQTKRGDQATFFRVFPHQPDGIELAEVRAEAIGPTRDDLEIAIDRIRRGLGLHPLFPSEVNHAEC